jgi:hypothetical protein
LYYTYTPSSSLRKSKVVTIEQEGFTDCIGLAFYFVTGSLVYLAFLHLQSRAGVTNGKGGMEKLGLNELCKNNALFIILLFKIWLYGEIVHLNFVKFTSATSKRYLLYNIL